MSEPHTRTARCATAVGEELEARGIALRAVQAEDAPFLYEVYANTRAEELAVTGWTETEKEQFLRHQFDAQTRHYEEHFADAEFSVVLRRSQPIGRLYLGRWEDEIRIVDIALLPEHRNRGIGSRLIRAVLDEAAGDGKTVRIHVERNNPALGLYRRLGFAEVREQGVYFLMEWVAEQGRPDSGAAPAAGPRDGEAPREGGAEAD